MTELLARLAAGCALFGGFFILFNLPHFLFLPWARSHLWDLRDQVAADQRSGRLTTEDGDRLIKTTEQMIDIVSDGPPRILRHFADLLWVHPTPSADVPAGDRSVPDVETTLERLPRIVTETHLLRAYFVAFAATSWLNLRWALAHLDVYREYSDDIALMEEFQERATRERREDPTDTELRKILAEAAASEATIESVDRWDYPRGRSGFLQTA